MKRVLTAFSLVALLLVLTACGAVRAATQSTSGDTGPASAQPAGLIGTWTVVDEGSPVASLEFREDGQLIQRLADTGAKDNLGTWSSSGSARLEADLSTRGFGDRKDIVDYRLTGSSLFLKQVSGESWLLGATTGEVELSRQDGQ